MVNYTDFMAVDDFEKIAEEIDIDWDKQPGNDTDEDVTTEPPWNTPPPQRNVTGDGTLRNPIDVHVTDGFGLHIVGHSFGGSNKVIISIMLSTIFQR